MTNNKPAKKQQPKKKAKTKAPAKPRKPRITKQQREVAKAAVNNLLKKRYVRNFFGMPSSEELIDGNNYVVGRDGLYLVRKNRVGLFVSHLAQTKEPIPLIEKHQQPTEGFYMTLENKIPWEFMLKTVAFFKKVYHEKNSAEAVVQIFYNQEAKSYFFHVDQQGVSRGSAQMDRDAKLETEHLLVADFHSHNDMKAFFSGTDNHDEKEARIYGVMGRFNKPWPEMLFRAGDGKGGWIELNMFQVFETPDVGVVEIPDEWMKRVHDPKTYKGKSSYYQHKHHSSGSKGKDDGFSEYYDRYVPQERRGVFGRAGTPQQDELNFPIRRWETDIDWEDEDLQQFLDGGIDLSMAIESLVESSDVLDNEECKAMWLSLVKKLEPISIGLLKDALDNVYK